jgi:hypothetical protein
VVSVLGFVEIMSCADCDAEQERGHCRLSPYTIAYNSSINAEGCFIIHPIFIYIFHPLSLIKSLACTVKAFWLLAGSRLSLHECGVYFVRR